MSPDASPPPGLAEAAAEAQQAFAALTEVMIRHGLEYLDLFDPMISKPAAVVVAQVENLACLRALVRMLGEQEGLGSDAEGYPLPVKERLAHRAYTIAAQL